MDANYYYSKSRVQYYWGTVPNVIDKGDTTHRSGRRKDTYVKMNNARHKLSKQDAECMEKVGSTLIETNQHGERIYGVCMYPIKTTCQVKPPIKSLFGHKREDSVTYG